MNNKQRSMNNRSVTRLSPSRIAMIYAIVGGFWIILSDRVVNMTSKDPEVITHLQTYKGWFYVAISTLIVYGLSRHYGKRLMSALSAARDNEERIQQLNNILEKRNAELDAERARWKSVVESIPDEVWVADQDGKMRLINLPGQAKTDNTDRFVEGVLKDIEILNLDGKVRDREESPLLRSLKGQVIRGEEIMRDRGTGMQRYRQYNSAPVRSSDGTVKGAVAVVRDITDIREAEEALRESQARLEGIASAAFDAVILINNDGNVSFWNDAAEKMFGYTRQEIMGKYMHAYVMPDRYSDVFVRGFRTFQETGTGPLVGSVYEIEAKRKDGSEFPVELSLSALKLKDKWCAIGIVRDITGRKRVDEQVERISTQNKLILEFAGDGIWGVDTEGLVTFMNHAGAAMLGFETSELLGQPSHEKWHYQKKDGTIYPSSECPIYAAYKDGKSHSGEEVFWKKDGSGIPVDFSSRPIFEAGRIVGAVVTFKDISERKSAEEERDRLLLELKRSNMELEQFAYIASHDLQEPLRMVGSYTTLLMKRYKEHLDERALEYIHFAADGADRMQKLIEGLLSYSRISRKGAVFKPVDLNQAFSLAISNLSLAIKEAGAEITKDKLPVLSGDETQLIQLFQNLISNSVKYRKINRSPRIQVSSRKTGSSYLFSVKDNGIGIEAKFYERIFQIFQRLHTRSEYSGTGIGLALCKRIVERHRGRIWVESEPGEGSTFFFTIQA